MAQSLPNSTRKLVADASTLLGPFKHLQSTNYILSADLGANPKEIEETKDRIAQHWRETSTEIVLIYHHSDLFQGYGKTGSGGDASLPENYEFTQLDAEIGRVVKAGATACLQFEDCLDKYLDYATPELFEKIGYVLADRYGNGRNFWSKNALSLIELYPEPDMYTSHLTPDFYIPYFDRIASFARGCEAANSFVGVGACGANRMFYNAKTCPESPFHFEFYKYIKENVVPIKAITFHWVAPFSQNPYDLVLSAKSVRDEMTRAGLGNIPIWVTEYNRNPAPILPTEEITRAEYKSILTAASFMLSAQIIAQDADVAQCLPWVGVGYGFVGGGNAWFEAYYSKPTAGSKTDTINELGAAWMLSGKFLSETRQRIKLDGTRGCFSGLAGISETRDTVEILLSNYQFSDAMLVDMNMAYYSAMGEESRQYMSLGENGLVAGEFYTFRSPPAPPGLSLTGPQPEFCVNKTKIYNLLIENLPWDAETRWTCTIFRVDGQEGIREYKTWKGRGAKFVCVEAFPASNMDLVVVKKDTVC